MTSVTAKLKLLPTWAKIALAATVAALLGVAGILFLGDAAGAIPGAGAGLGFLKLLFGGKGSGIAPDAPTLLRAEAKRVDEDAERDRAASDAAARDRAAAREVESERMAREAGADDGGDPRRVLVRHSKSARDRRK